MRMLFRIQVTVLILTNGQGEEAAAAERLLPIGCPQQPWRQGGATGHGGNAGRSTQVQVTAAYYHDD